MITFRRGILVAANLAVLAGMTLGLGVAGGAGTTVRPDPQSKAYVLGSAPGPLNIDIRVENVTNLGGFQFALTWDPAILSPINDPEPGNVLSPGPFLGSTGRPVVCMWDLTQAGRAFMLCYTNGASPAGPSGSGVLATMHFQAPNTSQVVTSQLGLTQVEVVEIDGTVVPTTVQNGVIAVVECHDVDGNNFVNIFDVSFVAARFGQTPSSPGWDPAADVNGDGFVNIFDLSMVAAAFGLSCG